jgi:hypothetical protein
MTTNKPMVRDPEAGGAPTVEQALAGALTMLEALGITGGDVHDDLALAIDRLNWAGAPARVVMRSEL